MVGGAPNRAYSAAFCLSHSLTCLLQCDVASVALLCACYKARWKALLYCMSEYSVYKGWQKQNRNNVSVQQTHQNCRARVCISDITRDAMSSQLNNAVYCQTNIAVHCHG